MIALEVPSIRRKRMVCGHLAVLIIVNYVDTFKAPEPGYIGGFFNNRLFYYGSPMTPTCEFPFERADGQSKKRSTLATSPRCPKSTLSMATKSSTHA